MNESKPNANSSLEELLEELERRAMALVQYLVDEDRKSGIFKDIHIEGTKVVVTYWEGNSEEIDHWDYIDAVVGHLPHPGDAIDPEDVEYRYGNPVYVVFGVEDASSPDSPIHPWFIILDTNWSLNPIDEEAFTNDLGYVKQMLEEYGVGELNCHGKDEWGNIGPHIRIKNATPREIMAFLKEEKEAITIFADGGPSTSVKVKYEAGWRTDQDEDEYLRALSAFLDAGKDQCDEQDEDYQDDQDENSYVLSILSTSEDELYHDIGGVHWYWRKGSDHREKHFGTAKEAMDYFDSIGREDIVRNMRLCYGFDSDQEGTNIYPFEVRHPFVDGPEKWQPTVTVSRHRTLAGAKVSLKRQQAGARKQGGHVEDRIWVYNSKTGHWVPVDEESDS